MHRCGKKHWKRGCTYLKCKSCDTDRSERVLGKHLPEGRLKLDEGLRLKGCKKGKRTPRFE